MICSRCRRPLTSSSSFDQVLCAHCLRHLRAGGLWELGSPTPKGGRLRGPLDLDLLPLRAQVLFGEVPLYPTREYFERAALFVGFGEPAADWYIEAVRWRRGAGYGKPLEDGLPIIAGRTAARLWRLAERNAREATAT